MKKMFMMPLAAFAVMFTACSDSDSKSQSAADLKGTYTLSHSSGSIAGGSYDFDYGVITWTFDPAAHKVTVVNNNDDPDAYDGPDSGTYTYAVVNSENPQQCEKVLKVNSVDYGCFDATDTKLTLTNTFADGYVFDFSRLILE